MIEILTEPRPIETVPALKLSEALRLGAMHTRQAFGVMTDGRGAYCAIGTIWLAMGLPVGSDDGLSEGPHWMFCHHEMDLAPFRYEGCFHCLDLDVADLVMHLNDYHSMPRNQIADLLEGAGL